MPGKVCISPDVLFQEFDGETVLLDRRTSVYFELDEVGTRAWQLLAENESLEPIVATLLTEYAVDEATLRRDLQALIDQLSARGLVQVDPGP
ncbi:MAG TPA: PqqD family protein [Thermoleophilaceae bacterium]